MSQHYSNPERENEPNALPDVELFYHHHKGGCEASCGPPGEPCSGPGRYYWFCLPGCLPDSDPVGPFSTGVEALKDARNQ